MSLTEVLAELPTLTTAERQLLIRRALDCDQPALSDSDVALVDSRLAEHRANPATSVSLAEMKSRLRAHFES